jgi:hypothetical protein
MKSSVLSPKEPVRKLDLTDAWAIRELKICVRSFENLPPAARRLVEHLKAS